MRAFPEASSFLSMIRSHRAPVSPTVPVTVQAPALIPSVVFAIGGVGLVCGASVWGSIVVLFCNGRVGFASNIPSIPSAHLGLHGVMCQLSGSAPVKALLPGLEDSIHFNSPGSDVKVRGE